MMVVNLTDNLVDATGLLFGLRERACQGLALQFVSLLSLRVRASGLEVLSIWNCGKTDRGGLCLCCRG